MHSASESPGCNRDGDGTTRWHSSVRLVFPDQGDEVFGEEPAHGEEHGCQSGAPEEEADGERLRERRRGFGIEFAIGEFEDESRGETNASGKGEHREAIEQAALP